MFSELLGGDVERRGRYLPELVYGANDGIVTTFAVVAAVAGAALSPSIVLVLGVANLLADGFAMGASNFLSQRSERDYRAAAGVVEPDGDKPPVRTGLATFVAFVLAGAMPLVPYALALEATFTAAVAVTAVTFFGVGAARSLVTARSWYRNGAEMLAVGTLAAGVAYGLGVALGGLA